MTQAIRTVLEGLAASHAILADLVESMSEEALSVRRREGFWTIAEHVAHLADVQPMLADRIGRILNEDTPEFIPFFPDEDAEEEEAPIMPVAEALAAFKEGRDRQLVLLGEATAGDWERLAIHPEYEHYGLRILARHILMHDHWHMYRMEELWLTRDEYLTRVEG